MQVCTYKMANNITAYMCNANNCEKLQLLVVIPGNLMWAVDQETDNHLE